MQLTRLAEAFRSLGYPVAEGEPMSRHTSFKVGGPADMFVTVPDGKGAAAVLYRCREAGIPVLSWATAAISSSAMRESRAWC